MGPELAREVKREILDRLAAAVDRVETNVIYAIAEKPPVNGRGDR